MKKLLFATAALLLFAGSAEAQVSVAAACSSQTLPVGYNNGTLIITQDGDLCISGGGGGGGGTASFTAAADGTIVVTAGGNKPAAIDLFSSLSVQVKDATGTAVDWTAPVPVTQSGTWNITNISGAISLPTGAATAAKQPALGTAGTPSADVITVQGNAAGTPLPVSGTVTVGSVVGGGPVSNGTAQAGSLLIGAVFNTTKPTLTTGQQAALQTTNRGELFVVPLNAAGNPFTGTAAADAVTSVTGLATWSQTALRGASNWSMSRDILGSFGAGTGVQAVEQAGSSFQYISTATTTQVKSGAGILHKVIVNTCVASATIGLLDNTSGSTVNIGQIACPSTVGNPFTITYDLGFATGLRVVTSGATNITVVYR